MLRGPDVGVDGMRVQLVRRHVAPEMLALSVMELILTFTLALILMTPASSSPNLASIHSALACAVTVGFIAFIIGLYRPQMFERARSLLLSSCLSALISFPAVWLVSKTVGLGSYWPVGFDALRPIKIVVIWCLGVFGIRLIFLMAARLNFFVHRVAVVAPVESPSVMAALRAGRKGFLEISVVGPEGATPIDLATSGIHTLVLTTGVEDVFTPDLLKRFENSPIRVQAESEFWERHLRRVDIVNFRDSSGTAKWEQSQTRGSTIYGRAFDLIFSCGLLIATLPIIAIVAVLIRLDSYGSVLYKQERVGLNNVPFTLLKFRSMKIDAEILGPRWAQQKDPRVTRVGYFIRRTRIDELPQLLNILRGEMSFIGPRPERQHFVEQLSQVIPNYQERSRVKPGLTGWAQVNYPYGASVEDARAKLSFDLYYVKNKNLLLDVLILLSTVRVILLQEGAR